MRSADITFVILTKNEAARIAACLHSLPEGAGAVVFDALSGDDTLRIATACGAQAVAHPWRGFVAARLAAASLVTTPWTFMLDADERVTPALVNELAKLDSPAGVSGYRVARRNWFCGRQVRCAGWWPDRLVRLFRTGRARLQARSGGVHERWEVDGRVADLHNPLEHFSYDSLAQYRAKFNAYTDLEARGQHRSLAGAVGAWLFVPLRFLWWWLLRGGALEGWRGAFVCAASAAYPAVAATKSWRSATRSA